MVCSHFIDAPARLAACAPPQPEIPNEGGFRAKAVLREVRDIKNEGGGVYDTKLLF